MLYSLYEASYAAAAPLRAAARLTRDFWSSPLNPAKDSDLGRRGACRLCRGRNG
jgi:poly(3-hydroxybutyrate) depolymerase